MPTRKVSVGAVAGAVVALALFLLGATEPKIADQINSAVAVAASTLIATILSYVIPEADQQP